MIKGESIKKYLDIQENFITCIQPCKIIIDLQEFNDTELVDTGPSYIIPGLITVIFEKDTAELPFFYPVNLIKPKEIEKDGSKLTLSFEQGDTLIQQDFKAKDTDQKIVERIFEQRIPYLAAKPTTLIYLAWNEVFKGFGNKKYKHFEIIMSELYRCPKELKKPFRLCSKGGDYVKAVVFGVSDYTMKLRKMQGLAFGYTNKTLANNILNKENLLELSDMEKLMINQY